MVIEIYTIHFFPREWGSILKARYDSSVLVKKSVNTLPDLIRNLQDPSNIVQGLLRLFLSLGQTSSDSLTLERNFKRFFHTCLIHLVKFFRLLKALPNLLILFTSIRSSFKIVSKSSSVLRALKNSSRFKTVSLHQYFRSFQYVL